MTDRRTILKSLLGGGVALGTAGPVSASLGAAALTAVRPDLLKVMQRHGAVVMRYRGRADMGAAGPVSRGWRVVVPVALARAWSGELYLQAEQLSGASRSGLMGTVKSFKLERILTLREAGGRFRCQSRDIEARGFLSEIVAARPDVAVIAPRRR